LSLSTRCRDVSRPHRRCGIARRIAERTTTATVGIRDVAQKAGVAISTVSKVFSGKGEVMPALRLRVLTAASELGYRPNSVAQSLRRGATDLVGFVASDLAEPFSAGIVAGAESAAPGRLRSS
jgi:LacI family transcriptional regulator